LKAKSPEELDAIQQRNVRWWYNYRMQLQLETAEAINAAIAKHEIINSV